MKKMIPMMSLVISFSAFAGEIDYSRCNQSLMMSGLSLDNDGKVQSSPYFEITDIKTDGKKETYTIKAKGGALMGGYPGTSSSTVSVVRDDQGRIIMTTSGDSKPSDKTIKEYKTNMAKMMGTFASGTYEPSVFFDPNAGERADGGSPRLIPVSQLSKKELLTMGIDLSPEDLKKMQKQWKKDKKTQKKLADAYEKIYQAPQFIPTGTSSYFEFIDGACVPTLMTSNAYNEKTKTVSTTTTYSKQECEQVETVFLKHQKKMNECQTYEAKEMQKDWNTIYGGSMNGFGGYGMGMSMGFGYGGYGMAGSSMSQLQQKKNLCDMYKSMGGPGGYAGGVAGGISSGSSKATNQ